MIAFGVAQPPPEAAHVPDNWLISTSALSPFNSTVISFAPSFCKVLILFEAPVISQFQITSSLSQSTSNTFELPMTIKSAFKRSALKAEPWSKSKVLLEPVTLKFISESSELPVLPTVQSITFESPVKSNL